MTTHDRRVKRSNARWFDRLQPSAPSKGCEDGRLLWYLSSFTSPCWSCRGPHANQRGRRTQGTALMATLQSLTQRVEQAENNARAVRSNLSHEDKTPSLRRVEADLHGRHVLGAMLWKVPGDYYDRPLAARAQLLASPVERLCKTLILENEAADPSYAGVDSLNDRKSLALSRYIAVVVPYEQKLVNTDVLARLIKSYAGVGGDVRLKQAEKGDELTGFPFNGVTIFGWTRPMPIILSKAAAHQPAPAYIWLGGGEADVKLRLFVSEALRTTGAHVMDCTLPREAADEED